MKKILWLHHRKGWAIHNIGKTWLGHLPNVDYRYYLNVNPQELDKYDIVFHFMKSWKAFPRRQNEILVLHDPIEILESNGMPKREIESCVMKSKHCIVESMELKGQVRGLTGRDVVAVTTMSHLSPSPPANTPCSFITLCTPQARKNLKLIRALYDYSLQIKKPYLTKIGYKVIDDREYKQLFKIHPIYICTSHREGGPLPPMDSMSQGGVVITRPIGQMTELIQHGVNGFFCDRENDFKQIMQLFKSQPALLKDMRQKSYDTYINKRNIKNIRNTIDGIIASL